MLYGTRSMGHPAWRADAVPGQVSRGALSGSLDGFLPLYRAAGGPGVLSNSGVSTSKGHRETEKIKKKNTTKINQRLEKIPDSETLKELIHSINQKED